MWQVVREGLSGDNIYNNTCGQREQLVQGRKEVGSLGSRLSTEGKNGDQTDAPQPGNAAPMIRVETLGSPE